MVLSARRLTFSIVTVPSDVARLTKGPGPSILARLASFLTVAPNPPSGMPNAPFTKLRTVSIKPRPVTTPLRKPCAPPGPEGRQGPITVPSSFTGEPKRGLANPITISKAVPFTAVRSDLTVENAPHARREAPRGSPPDAQKTCSPLMPKGPTVPLQTLAGTLPYRRPSSRFLTGLPVPTMVLQY